MVEISAIILILAPIVYFLGFYLPYMSYKSNKEIKKSMRETEEEIPYLFTLLYETKREDWQLQEGRYVQTEKGKKYSLGDHYHLLLKKEIIPNLTVIFSDKKEPNTSVNLHVSYKDWAELNIEREREGNIRYSLERYLLPQKKEHFSAILAYLTDMMEQKKEEEKWAQQRKKETFQETLCTLLDSPDPLSNLHDSDVFVVTKDEGEILHTIKIHVKGKPHLFYQGHYNQKEESYRETCSEKGKVIFEPHLEKLKKIGKNLAAEKEWEEKEEDNLFQKTYNNK